MDTTTRRCTYTWTPKGQPEWMFFTCPFEEGHDGPHGCGQYGISWTCTAPAGHEGECTKTYSDIAPDGRALYQPDRTTFRSRDASRSRAPESPIDYEKRMFGTDASWFGLDD